MKTLIIAEKPSLAANICKGISEQMSKRDGYYESDSYIVTWAFGHLFTLCDVEKYSPSNLTYWTLDNLPCFPNKFEYELKKDRKTGKTDTGIQKQFNTITNLINRDDVGTVANAGDSDREGEVIVRLIIVNSLKRKKNFVRLWLPDQTPKTIADALLDMKSEQEYNSLANEGYARQYLDWLYGINLTRYASVKARTLMRVGRVLTPIVKEIYDRDMEIKNFVPQKYFGVESSVKGTELTLTSSKKFKANESDSAQQWCNQLNSCPAVVKDIKQNDANMYPSKLFSLTKLQSYLGDKYKMPMEISLATCQSLYEKGFLTYPRTNSEYLARAEIEKMDSILKTLISQGNKLKLKTSKSIFDDSKVESHSALTPTYNIPDISKLNANEQTVYSTVMNRFLAVFCEEDCITSKTEIQIDIGNGAETITLKGQVINQKGWTVYEAPFVKDKLLPNFTVGEKLEVDFRPINKQTTPPPHYTIKTLNAFLKNPFRKESDTDDDDYKAMFEGVELGTEATRTGIITNACNAGYIMLKGSSYYILDTGVKYIDALNEMGINLNKNTTVEVSKALKKVYKSEITKEDAINLAKAEIQKVFDENKQTVIAANEICKCPFCDGSILQYKWGYGCSNYKKGCKFSINKEMCGKKLTAATIKKLCANRTTSVMEFKSKNGKKFKARIVIDNANKIAFKFD